MKNDYEVAALLEDLDEILMCEVHRCGVRQPRAEGSNCELHEWQAQYLGESMDCYIEKVRVVRSVDLDGE